MSPQEITAHFHRKIPISKQMGIQVLEVTSRRALIEVPLAPNINHVQTAFGGSLYAAAALSCYALFQVLSREAGGLSDDLVIQEGRIRYTAPTSGNFKVEATLVNDDDGQTFIEALRRHQRARLNLHASVTCNGIQTAVFEGTYVFKSKA